jgi:molybdenum cofactor guanylyltransferase
MNFSAVILAGGRSSRMGRDKAWLETGGQTLLARQIGLARKLGAAEVFISGRAKVDYSAFGCRVLEDKFADAGPLAGIERALDAMQSPLLLVLAVDLPQMNEDLLRRLSAGAANAFGAIPKLAGHIEPLAAFYPKAAMPLLVKLLDGSLPLTPALSPGERGNYFPSPDESTTNSGREIRGEPTSLQRLSPLPKGEGQGKGEHVTKKLASAKRFAELCVQSGLACFVELGATDTHYFANWNSPADTSCQN